MTYTGDVRVGGPVDVRETTDLVITKVAVGPMDNNAYLLRCRASGARLLIDAAAEPRTLLALLSDGEGGGNEDAGGTRGGLEAVLTTHRHPDHWRALAEVVAATGARTLAGREDVAGIPVPTDEPLDDGAIVRVGQVDLIARRLVGHTPGSVALVYRDLNGHPHVFTGDSLFPGGVGNTQRDPVRFDSLINDVQTKIFTELPDQTWVYPGHGKDTTLGAERPQLPQWRARGW
jgi:glyoxylase-like metal-dependent hydrolase (beta-lactamase superfamily II)